MPIEEDAVLGQESDIGAREEEQGAEEEGMKPKTKSAPIMPSRKEVEEHMTTHIPFRNWCAHCVRGKSKSNPHRQTLRDINEVPEVSLDYMYMGSGSDEEQLGMPILVARDRKTGWYMAGVVPNKGKCAHAVRRIEGMIDQLGYRKYILKPDQEPAIMELKELVKRGRDDAIIMGESPVEDSRSNGYVERATQAVQDHIRTMRSALEGRIWGGGKVGSSWTAVARNALGESDKQIPERS